jgi:PKD repeat protein
VTASLGGTTYTWWNVNFDSGPDGWVADIGLSPVSVTPPDLVVQNFSVSPSSGPAGTSVNVTFTIRNTGGGAAAPSRTNLRLATPC